METADGTRARWRLLIALAVILVALAAAASTVILYRAAIDAEIERVGDLAGSQSRLIEAVAHFDSIHSQADDPEGAAMATLGQVAKGHAAWLQRDTELNILAVLKGPTGSLAIVHQGQVLRAGQRQIPNTVSPVAADLAVTGGHGALITRQSDGVAVIAGYDFIPLLQVGIVVQVPLAKVRRPFIHAGVISALAALVIAALGAWAVRQTSLPLVKELQRQLDERRAAEAELARHQTGLEKLVAARTAELEIAQAGLVKSEKLATLGRILATVSHELRNPLGTLTNSIFSLAERMRTTDAGVDAILSRAQRSIERCNGIIDELLTFTRVRSPSRTVVDLHTWLLGFVQEIGAEVPFALESSVVAGTQLLVDPEDLRRCLTNLVFNSAHALVAAGRTRDTGRLTISALLSGSTLKLSVSDNGIGIESGVLPRVFEPLFSTKSFGVGLGLPIVRDGVIRNHGTIDIESTVGVGTTVHLCFPAGLQEGTT